MTRQFILGIDPGTTETAYCLCMVDNTITGDKPPLLIADFAKVKNNEMRKFLHKLLNDADELKGKDGVSLTVAIEHLESYGSSVGKSTFETAYFIGSLKEICFPYTLSNPSIVQTRIYRHEEKMRICHSMRANDATIKQQLVDMFADHPEKNHGKGTKAEPDFFYGMKADCWSAFAICYTEWSREGGLPC